MLKIHWVSITNIIHDMWLEDAMYLFKNCLKFGCDHKYINKYAIPKNIQYTISLRSITHLDSAICSSRSVFVAKEVIFQFMIHFLQKNTQPDSHLFASLKTPHETFCNTFVLVESFTSGYYTGSTLLIFSIENILTIVGARAFMKYWDFAWGSPITESTINMLWNAIILSILYYGAVRQREINVLFTVGRWIKLIVQRATIVPQKHV